MVLARIRHWFSNVVIFFVSAKKMINGYDVNYLYMVSTEEGNFVVDTIYEAQIMIKHLEIQDGDFVITKVSYLS